MLYSIGGLDRRPIELKGGYFIYRRAGANSQHVVSGVSVCVCEFVCVCVFECVSV